MPDRTYWSHLPVTTLPLPIKSLIIKLYLYFSSHLAQIGVLGCVLERGFYSCKGEMQSSFYARQRQAGAAVGLSSKKKRARMRGLKPTVNLFSTKLPSKTAHVCAVFPNGTPNFSVSLPNWKKDETNLRPAHDGRFNKQSSRNKPLSSQTTTHDERFGFASHGWVSTGTALRIRSKRAPEPLRFPLQP